MHARTAMLVLAFLSGATQAQLKPPADMTTPTTRPAPATTPAVDPVIEAKEQAAAKVAGEWLKLIDSGDYGKAWDECSTLFKEKVGRQQWVDGLPKNRAEVGAFKGRKLDGAAYRKSMPGAPEGEYVSLRFFSDFEKNPSAQEMVTLVYQDGAWRPIGYLLR
ncbi:MAG TPA: DUF4019 domain-containing protein [Burkholderiaceae bacterium]|nr:DUF4019 domain-containing protein [Burkholderiaceae bacterium]